jgi:hypothetical protein
MANSIALAKNYEAILDEVYAVSAKTRILDNTSLIRPGTMANEILLPKMTLQGLGTYGKNTGFVSGDVTLAWETHSLAYDRGRGFQVDNMDNLESVEVAFGALAGEFVRTKVVPEIDAVRIARLCGKAANTATGATLTKSTVLTAIDTGTKVMDDAEVPQENRVIFVTPEVYQFIKQSDLFVRNVDIRTAGGLDMRADMINGMPIVMVPQSRMYTALTLYDGSTSGQEAGSYIKNASTGKDVNFVIVHTPSVMGVVKHVAPRVFAPEVNQSADAWKFQYRVYHDLLVPDNKTNGIYVHPKA